MTEQERIDRAREYRAAAVERREFVETQMEDPMAYEGKPDVWWAAQQNISDGMLDRINLIDDLFPEIHG